MFVNSELKGWGELPSIKALNSIPNRKVNIRAYVNSWHSKNKRKIFA